LFCTPIRTSNSHYACNEKEMVIMEMERSKINAQENKMILRIFK